MRLRAGEGLLRETFAHFRRCGRGCTECVVYWTGPLEDPYHVHSVVHPVHEASPVHYEVNRAWAVAFALQQAEQGQAVRMQVHVHPGEAFHSVTDNEYALVSTPGFLSLVVPDHAEGAISLAGCFLAELTRDGSWRSISPAASIELGP